MISTRKSALIISSSSSVTLGYLKWQYTWTTTEMSWKPELLDIDMISFPVPQFRSSTSLPYTGKLTASGDSRAEQQHTKAKSKLNLTLVNPNCAVLILYMKDWATREWGRKCECGQLPLLRVLMLSHRVNVPSYLPVFLLRIDTTKKCTWSLWTGYHKSFDVG